MKNHPRFLFWVIIVFFAFALVLDLPKTKPIHIETPKLPGINKKISFNLPIYGSTVDFYINNQHVLWEFPFKKGLDLAGGTSVTLRAEMQKIPKDQKQDALNGVKSVLDKRVNLLGVSEPTIQTAQVGNDYRLIVDLPGINVTQAVSLIGTTAQLTFWEEGASGSAGLRNPATLPIGVPQILGVDAKETNLTGKDLKSATVVFDQNTGKPQVQLVFTNSGTSKFADITKRNVGKPVVIVLDNQVISFPTVNEPILTGNAVIQGQFTTDDAKNLTIELQGGSLPVPLTILAQDSIGATLGQSSLTKSLLAGALGFLIIAVFMIVLYGTKGMMASGALLVYTALVLGIFKLIPVTLTLAGIAGFILSIGMAVDANILIFERMKEELRAGKDYRQAIELGFSRAWSSIRDSNISTLITSVILFKFGTGIVRGFALTLAIGVIVSMFSAITITRTFLRVFHKN
jgi:preprotein translocase subunit SecD